MSQTAEAAAARTFLGMVTGGVPCGMWVNGVLAAGVDATREETGRNRTGHLNLTSTRERRP